VRREGKAYLLHALMSMEKNYRVSPENPNLRFYDAKQVVIKEGELDIDVIYLLQEGKLEVLKGKNKVSEIEECGVLFGELSPILGIPRTATIRTLEPSEILVYKGTIEELIGEQAPIPRMLIKTLAKRLEKTTQELNKSCDLIKELTAKIKELEKTNSELKMEDK